MLICSNNTIRCVMTGVVIEVSQNKLACLGIRFRESVEECKYIPGGDTDFRKYCSTKTETKASLEPNPRSSTANPPQSLKSPAKNNVLEAPPLAPAHKSTSISYYTPPQQHSPEQTYYSAARPA